MIEINQDLINEFSLWLESENLSIRSRREYVSRMNSMLSDKPMNQDIIEYLMDKQLVNRYNRINGFKAYLRFMKDKKYIDYELYEKTSKKFRYNRAERPKTKAYLKEEWKGIIRKMPPEVPKMAAWLILNFGFRIGELISLRVQNFDFERKTVTVLKMDDFIPKYNHERVLPMSDRQMKTIQKFLEYRKSQGITFDKLLFTKSGKPLTIRGFQRICTKAGIKAHDLRRSFATNFYLEFKDIYQLSFLLGHNSIETTELYIRISEEKMLNDIRNRLNGSS